MIPSPDQLEAAIGGSYVMPDGRNFWIDAPVAREITRRVMLTLPQIDAEVARLREDLRAINAEIDSLAGSGFAPRWKVIRTLSRMKQTCLHALGLGFER